MRKTAICEVCRENKPTIWHYKPVGYLCYDCSYTPAGTAIREDARKSYETAKADRRKTAATENEAWNQSVEQHGFHAGDRVRYWARAWFGLGGEAVFGTIARYRGRLCVKLDHKQPVNGCGFRRYVELPGDWKHAEVQQ